MNKMINPIPARLEEMPAVRKDPACEGGKLEELLYDTWESATYDEKSTPLKKRAIVYTPPGYDGKTALNVFVLMHGGWSNETTILGTPQHPSDLKQAVDHLIASSQMEPMILVCPTYNNLSEHDSWDYGLALQLTDRFPRELVQDLLPAIAKNYATFSEGSDTASLKASRDHWYFGGFSMGSVATWHVFEKALAYFSGFMPMSGNAGWSGPQMAQLVSAQGCQENDFFIFAMTGTADFAAQAFISQIASMAETGQPFIYTDDGLSGNLSLRVKDGYKHDRLAMETYIYNGLKWFGQGDETEDRGWFTGQTPISVVMRDPAFSGFGRLLFPLNLGYMSGKTLAEINLAWYSQIDPEKTVAILNYLKEQVLDQQKIFYSIYTEAEMKASPALRNTGLFFFRGLPGSPFALISAGGGFAYVAALHDSFPQALALSQMGLHAFALIYRPGAQTACEDLSRALQFIFENARTLQVDTEGYSLWSGSAGGRMTAWVSELGTAAFGAIPLPKPAADIIQYTGLQEVSPQDVPTYMNVGTNDSIAWYPTMQKRSQALNRLGIDSEIQVFPGLQHGFGLGTGTNAEGWIQNAVRFWLAHRKGSAAA